MPGVTETITTDGLKWFEDLSDDMRKRAKDKRQLNRTVAEGLLQNVKRRYVEETGPDGRWAPLKPSTQASFIRPAGEKGRQVKGERGGVSAQARHGKKTRTITGEKGFLGAAIREASKGLRAAGADKEKQSLTLQVLASRLGITQGQARSVMRERRGAGHILRRSGMMAKSTTKKATATEAIRGSNDPKIAFHQDGTPDMERRRVFGFDARDDRTIGDIVTRWIRWVMGMGGVKG